MANAGVTVFLTTHNLAEAARLCALVGIVRNGRLLAVAPPAQLSATRGAPSIEITGSGLTEAMLATLRGLGSVAAARADGRCLIVDLRSALGVAQVVAALVGAGFQVEAVRNSAGSLEDVFPTLLEAQT